MRGSIVSRSFASMQALAVLICDELPRGPLHTFRGVDHSDSFLLQA
jgi:hypothetical protein